MRRLQHFNTFAGESLLSRSELPVQWQEKLKKTLGEIFLRIQIGRGVVHVSLGHHVFDANPSQFSYAKANVAGALPHLLYHLDHGKARPVWKRNLEAFHRQESAGSIHWLTRKRRHQLEP